MTTKETICIIGACLFVLYIVTGPIICLVQIIRDKLAARAEHRRWQESRKPKPLTGSRKIGLYSPEGELRGSITLVDPEVIESRELMRKWEELQKGTNPDKR